MTDRTALEQQVKDSRREAIAAFMAAGGKEPGEQHVFYELSDMHWKKAEEAQNELDRLEVER